MADLAMVHAGNVLADDIEALYGPHFASAERYGDYTHLAVTVNWNPPACLPERAEGFSIADEPRRGWPAPDLSKQQRLL